jgi:hypothetical protein
LEAACRQQGTWENEQAFREISFRMPQHRTEAFCAKALEEDVHLAPLFLDFLTEGFRLAASDMECVMCRNVPDCAVR